MLHHVAQRIRGFFDFRFAIGFDVGRQQKTAVFDLHTVASVKHHHFITTGDAGVKRLKGAHHATVVQVFVQHHFKPGRPQLCGHGHGVIAGLLEFGDGLVIVIAHHQGNPLGLRRLQHQ